MRWRARMVGVVLCLASCAAHLEAQAYLLPVSKGAYRMPFEVGTEVTVWQDHVTHSPAFNRLDITPTDDTQSHNVVAAAGGWVEFIRDDLDLNCPKTAGACNGYAGPSANCCPPGAACRSQCRNNYVWLRHPNGEWSKYSHLQYLSVPATLDPGEWVDKGDFLGLEGDVGFASGVHLHFEVAVLDDPEGFDPTSSSAGAIPAVSGDDDVPGVNRQNRIPVFCQHGVLSQGETFDVQACDGLCPSSEFSLSGTYADDNVFFRQATNTVTTAGAGALVAQGAGVAVRAGQQIRLTTGFTAEAGSFFTASIGSCDSPGY